MRCKAYSMLRVKQIDSDQRIIRGIASTPTVDRMGDIVVPTGAKFQTPLPLLLYHDHDKPVGSVTAVAVTDEGIEFEAKLPDVPEPGMVKQRVDEAWHSIKHSLLAAVSIGFRVLEDGIEMLDNGGVKFSRWEWYELSLVAVPAQPEAVISSIKDMKGASIKALMDDGFAHVASDKAQAKRSDKDTRVWGIKL